MIVVDFCDLRKSVPYSINRAWGDQWHLELIAGSASLEDVVWSDRFTRMDFLPAVVRSEHADRDSILASDRMKTVFEELRARYEFVVVDLSPLAPVVDVSATSGIVDSYVLVIEWGRTKIDLVEHALHVAPEVREAVIGAVLNKADMKRIANHDARLTGYYYNKGYERYGYTDAWRSRLWVLPKNEHFEAGLFGALFAHGRPIRGGSSPFA